MSAARRGAVRASLQAQRRVKRPPHEFRLGDAEFFGPLLERLVLCFLEVELLPDHTYIIYIKDSQCL